jgi:hypothetical protein
MIWWGCDPSTDPERFNLETDKGRKAAIRQANPASGAFVNVADHARRYTKDHQANFLRYFLGLWTSREDSWLPAGAWGACQATEARDDLVWDRDREVWTVRDGADVVLGFDGSVSQDSTALVVWTRGDRPSGQFRLPQSSRPSARLAGGGVCRRLPPTRRAGKSRCRR